MTYTAVQVKDSRIDIRVTEDLLKRVDARCEVLGQSRTVFIERALESALKCETGVARAAPAPMAPSEQSASSRASAKSPALGKGFVPPRPKGT